MDKEPILQFFDVPQVVRDQMTRNEAEICGTFRELAHAIVSTFSRNPERTVALRHLLDARDAAMRAAIYKSE